MGGSLGKSQAHGKYILTDFTMTATGWTTKDWGSIPTRGGDLSVLGGVRTSNGPYPPSCSVVVGGCCPESEATGA